MFPALLATILFAGSVIAASRSVRLLGSHPANFWRVAVGALFLAAWAHGFGLGWGGGALGVFFLSGVIGFGLGDTALFMTLPRLGPRLSSLMINCLAGPFAALIEWLWLGTRLSPAQILCGLAILGGVGIALAPEEHRPLPLGRRLGGMAWGVLAGFGQGFGAVLSRKAYEVAAAAGSQVDGGTAAYQRILGGLAFVTLPYLWVLWRARIARAGALGALTAVPGAARRPPAWPWVLLNALSGPTLGVAAYQWALRTTPSGIVLPIVATSPLLVIPFTYWFEGDRPGGRSLAGAAVAVAGVIGLTLVR
jgi:drug/metabolite transporter (DMT)-like permease